MNKVKEKLRNGGSVMVFSWHHWEEGRELSELGVRWFTIHAKTLLARGARELGTLLPFAEARVAPLV